MHSKPDQYPVAAKLHVLHTAVLGATTNVQLEASRDACKEYLNELSKVNAMLERATTDIYSATKARSSCEARQAAQQLKQHDREARKHEKDVLVRHVATDIGLTRADEAAVVASKVCKT